MAGGDRTGGAGEETVDIHRLPRPGGEIFGRAAEIAWLDACWRDHAHVATVVAPGGMGKSSLVWTWLQGMLADEWRGAERVYGWSFYSQGTTNLHTSADVFVDAALRWLGDPDPSAGSPWDKGARLASLVRARRTLLVLDGVEPLQWGPGLPEEGKIKDPALSTLVEKLAEKNPGLCVITSRLPVREVADFAAVKSRKLDLGKLSDEAGVEALRARGVKGTEEELREAVQEYGGHGLALALLGSYLEEAAEGDVRRRKEMGPLEGDDRLGGHARRVMAAYEGMFGSGSAEVAVLRMLGLFDWPAEEEEIAALRAAPVVVGLTDAVAGLGGREWSTAVARLRRVGLLEKAVGVGNGRLDAHPLVREHFGERVRREREEAWREGHRRLYEYLKRKAKELPETVEEMAPLYAAVVHGCRAGRGPEALYEVWWKRVRRGDAAFSIKKLGAFGSEVAVLSAFFDPPWDRLAPGLSQANAAAVLNHAGFAHRALGRLPEAAKLLRMALARDIVLEDWKSAAISTSNLSELLQARGELREALEQAEKCVGFADKSGDAFQRMGKRTTLAAAQHAMGLRGEAAELFEEAERMQRDMQPAYPLLYSLPGFRYCELLLDQSRDAEVVERAAQTLEWRQGKASLLSIAVDHLSLGRAHLVARQRGAACDLAQAASHLAASVDGLRRAGRQDYLPLGLLARAALHTHTRAFALARQDLDEALTLATRHGFRLHEADTHLGHARLCLAQVDPAAARDHLARARRIIDETEYHRRDDELAQLEAEAAAMPEPPPPPLPPTPSPAMTAPIKLFYSYSHKDEALRDALETHLSLLKRQSFIEGWHDRKIPVGAKWADVIDENLAKADVILLLVSADFIASDYCYEKEMTCALDWHDAGQALVVPIALRPCDWSGARFAKLQGLPRDAKPVTTWSNQDEAWTDVARGLRRAIEDLRKRRSAAAEHAAPHPLPPHPSGGATPAPTRPEQDRLLDALCALLPAQLDALVFKLAVPPAYLSASTAPQATRCTEILRWAQQRGSLADVARLIVDVGGAVR